MSPGFPLVLLYSTLPCDIFQKLLMIALRQHCKEKRSCGRGTVILGGKGDERQGWRDVERSLTTGLNCSGGTRIGCKTSEVTNAIFELSRHCF
jgi:hypothetical protein